MTSCLQQQHYQLLKSVNLNSHCYGGHLPKSISIQLSSHNGMVLFNHNPLTCLAKKKKNYTKTNHEMLTHISNECFNMYVSCPDIDSLPQVEYPVIGVVSTQNNSPIIIQKSDKKRSNCDVLNTSRIQPTEL